MSAPVLSLIPYHETGLRQQLEEILDLAEDQAGVKQKGIFTEYEYDVQAVIAFNMLTETIRRQGELKVSQGFIVAYVAYNELWRFHPEDFASLRHYLKATGLTGSSVYDFAGFGEVVVPYCVESGIDLAATMTPTRWSKLREALPALKAAVHDDDKERLEDILSDVKQAPDRDAIRAKYRKRRGDPLGHAGTAVLPDGRVLFLAVLDSSEATAILIRKIDGVLDWDLAFVSDEGRLHFECPSIARKPATPTST